MADTIPIREWLRVIDSEYLSTFIKEGGSSIKFAVATEDQKAQLYESATNECNVSGYMVVRLNAEENRVHMPQDIFWGIAKQVDWRESARRMVLRLAKEVNFRVEGIDPRVSANVFDPIAATNNLEAESVLRELRPILEERVFKNDQMAVAFRVAMLHLCLSENTRGDEYRGQPLIDWLTGINNRISGVRQFHIYTGINRTTARHFIESALYWLQYVGYAGTLIFLDNSRVLIPRNPRDGIRFYTRPMAMDHYELLREFIDRAHRLTGALLVVVTNNQFLDDSTGSGSRGYGMYEALRTRVMDDVRDKNQANPVASLVRLS